MDIKKLKHIVGLINLKQVCISAGLNQDTIRSKLRRQTELTVVESKKLKAVLKEIAKAIEDED